MKTNTQTQHMFVLILLSVVIIQGQGQGWNQYVEQYELYFKSDQVIPSFSIDTSDIPFTLTIETSTSSG